MKKNATNKKATARGASKGAKRLTVKKLTPKQLKAIAATGGSGFECCIPSCTYSTSNPIAGGTSASWSPY